MSTVVNRRVDDVLRELLEGDPKTVLVVDPLPSVVEKLVDIAIETDDPPVLRLLSGESTVKSVLDDFLVASNAADLVSEGILSIRVAATSPGNELLITGERLTALVNTGNETIALSTDEAEFVEAGYEHYSDRWAEAEEYTLRTPPLSRVRETLREEIGEEAASDFAAVLESLETARGDGDGLDEVTISLLVAAKNEELLYDISKWGEDVGIASKATFSRTKTTLEDLGLIDTEKVPIDVGRPRLRLKFANGSLQSATADELASVAQGLMG